VAPRDVDDAAGPRAQFAAMSDRERELMLRTYARYAPEYERRWARYSAVTLTRALAAVPQHDEAHLVDVACGTGLFARMLRERHPGIRVTGVDLSAAMLEVAARRLPPSHRGHVQWRQGSAEALPLEPASCDIITCTNAFHLVPDAAAALREFRRALKPDGRLVIVDWCRDFLAIKALALGYRLRSGFRRQVRTMDEMTRLLARGGFIVDHAGRFRASPFWGMMIHNASPAASTGAA
jgi:SAM-dependent methyltransferase